MDKTIYIEEIGMPMILQRNDEVFFLYLDSVMARLGDGRDRISQHPRKSNEFLQEWADEIKKNWVAYIEWYFSNYMTREEVFKKYLIPAPKTKKKEMMIEFMESKGAMSLSLIPGLTELIEEHLGEEWKDFQLKCWRAENLKVPVIKGERICKKNKIL